MIEITTDAIVTDLAPRIPTVATPTGAEHFPNGLPPGTSSPTHSRAGSILLDQLEGDEQDLPGGHGRAGLAAEAVLRPLTALDQFSQELDRLLPR